MTLFVKWGFFLVMTLGLGFVVTGQLVKQETEVHSLPSVMSPTPAAARQQFRVSQVIDGDTIELVNGQRVRYIGIDTPEVAHRNTPAECYGPEAAVKNRELVAGKVVTLEADVSDVDKFDRWLRYVWVDDVLVNEYLAREGYARANSYWPDVKYQERLDAAELSARSEGKGLWERCSAL